MNKELYYREKQNLEPSEAEISNADDALISIKRQWDDFRSLYQSLSKVDGIDQEELRMWAIDTDLGLQDLLSGLWNHHSEIATNKKAMPMLAITRDYQIAQQNKRASEAV